MKRNDFGIRWHLFSALNACISIILLNAQNLNILIKKQNRNAYIWKDLLKIPQALSHHPEVVFHKVAWLWQDGCEFKDFAFEWLPSGFTLCCHGNTWSPCSQTIGTKHVFNVHLLQSGASWERFYKKYVMLRDKTLRRITAHRKTTCDGNTSMEQFVLLSCKKTEMGHNQWYVTVTLWDYSIVIYVYFSQLEASGYSLLASVANWMPDAFDPDQTSALVVL